MVGVEKCERVVPSGIVKRKRPFEVRSGVQQVPNMMGAGANNPMPYDQRATVALSLRKAQQFVGDFNCRCKRRSRRVEGPLPKEHGKKLFCFTKPSA